MLGTFIGSVAGGRVTFLAMGVFTLAVFVLLLMVVPALPAAQATCLDMLSGMFRGVTPGTPWR